MWEEKEEGSHDDSSYSKYKIKEGHKFQSSKKNVQGTLHALIKVGRKKKRGVMMKAAIQNTKYKRHKFQSSKKNIQGTHHRLIRCGWKKKMGVRMTAAIQNTK